MLYAILGFVLQLSILYLLVAMFILIDLLLWTTRARRFREARDRRSTERHHGAERRRIGDRPSNTGRGSQAPASMVELPIRRNEFIPGIRRRAVLLAPPAVSHSAI
jgi:hypothetical protein